MWVLTSIGSIEDSILTNFVNALSIRKYEYY